ncbi:aminotransferase class V-fold PLP-dependent enzyme [Scleromatobacter humisilvae]|uniref:Aminotransferase class V-fold PLP-dependent enzyme n=1 Tax=Scleromatobacter humisilvae TaxID=2897159 RepID=A0A9X1YGL5_9BURK|nr:aminotransferase class V-fold PLP-dependent enzyme [Scleromatobacter humisilvae]MCK9684313.1 aminotransferase class V-fold PLP-dependent enzyme [Scleromatobacter humisilvae]
MPTFGRSFLTHWWLDPAITYLNHGTVGATPRVVLETQQAWQRRIEAQPAAFLFRELMRVTADEPGAPRLLLRQAADAVAEFVGARGDDLVFVDNASTGINAVLRSIALQPGDEIVVLDQAYGAVIKAAEFVARGAGARVVIVATPFPVQGDPTDACVDAVERALTPRTRLAILDHISSHTALTLPVAAMTARCKARGVPVLIDGAHAPGAIALDISSLGADWYVGNLHKWAFAPRACGFLWVAPAHRVAIHPPTISWGLDVGLAQEFDWTGTRDPSAMLSAPAGIAFMRDVLGLAAMRTWNHDLVWRMAHELSARWGQPFTTPESMVGCMASVALPARIDALGESAAPALKDWLFLERRIEAQVLAIDGHVCVRLAAQVYNDESDYERLADSVDEWPA